MPRIRSPLKRAEGSVKKKTTKLVYDPSEWSPKPPKPTLIFLTESFISNLSPIFSPSPNKATKSTFLTRCQTLLATIRGRNTIEWQIDKEIELLKMLVELVESARVVVEGVKDMLVVFGVEGEVGWEQEERLVEGARAMMWVWEGLKDLGGRGNKAEEKHKGERKEGETEISDDQDWDEWVSLSCLLIKEMKQELQGVMEGMRLSVAKVEDVDEGQKQGEASWEQEDETNSEDAIDLAAILMGMKNTDEKADKEDNCSHCRLHGYIW